MWLVVGMGALAFIQAVLFYPSLYRVDRGGDRTPATDSDLPAREVRVLVSGGVPVLYLKTPHDLPEADRQDFLALDELLFPGGERHRYYLLVILNDGEEEIVFDLSAETLVLEDDEGNTHSPIELLPVVRARAAELPAYLLPQLRLWLTGTSEVTLPPFTRRTLLLAYPESADPERLVRARHGVTVLEPGDVVKDRVDADLDVSDAVLRAKRP